MAYVEPPPDERGQRPWTIFPSPLRYPGGKRKLAPFVKLLLEANGLVGGEYAEPYAGGAAVALGLLYEEYVRRIHINDLDPAVHAFWLAARDHPEELCRRVSATSVSIDEWHRQRGVFRSTDPDLIDLAFATLFLNRTNRSGILTGGPIGGYSQTGDWKLNARFRRTDLIHRIEKVGRFAARIEVAGLDAGHFLRTVARALPARSLVYCDPPYLIQGREELYQNSYRPEHHAGIAALLTQLDRPWMVTYNDAPEIRALYASATCLPYDISYSAQGRYHGNEVAFFSAGLRVPAVVDPARVERGAHQAATSAARPAAAVEPTQQ